MKRCLPLFVFLPVSFSLFAYSWAQELPEIIIEDADATTTIDLVSPPADFFAVDNPPFLLPDEAAICHADAREAIDLATPPEDFFDASEVDLRLPDEVAICHADERLTINLVAPPEEFFDPAPEVTDKFVYVALGDSYQSGEGAGNSIQDSARYLSEAYEQGTYTDTLVSGNDSCHRALQNYAKINKNKFKPELSDDDIVLIDLTCSGAKIETGPRPPVVGDMASNQIAPNSQLQQALDKLGEAGLAPADVDLVTVGMGGNDAGFAELAKACVTSSLLNKIIKNAPGEVRIIANGLANCENIDKLNYHIDDAINKLYDQEVWAQSKLLETFDRAKIMQLNYPNIMPVADYLVDSELCGGIRKTDLDYLRKKTKLINEKISKAVNDVRALGNDRLELVNIQTGFGINALCPSDSAQILVNGIEKVNLEAEVNRLLNDDEQSKSLLDKISSHYNEFKLSLGLGNNTKAALDLSNAKITFDQWVGYLMTPAQTRIIQTNLTELPPQQDPNLSYDRFQGLFHPNMDGHKLIACNVESAYYNIPPGACLPPTGPIIKSAVDGNQIGNKPIDRIPGNLIHLYIPGFAPNSTADIMIASVTQKIATATADNDGIVDANITLPDVGPGVHAISIEGQAANGVGLTKQFLVNYPGNPTANSSYGIYLTGFTPDNGTAEPEKVDINYMGITFETLTPDEAGGIFVEIPVLNQEEINITAKSRTTGKEVIQTIDVITDNISPELTFNFDQAKKDLVFTATDDISDPDNIVITDQNGVVTAADQAGNTTKLVFNEKNRKQSLRAQLKNISYNDTTVNLSSNRISFAWFYGYTPKIPAILGGLQSLPPVPANLPQSNTLKFLLQQARLNEGSFVVAIYANNKTRIAEYKNKKFNLKTHSGLKLLKFNTSNGKLSWSY